MHRRCIFYLGGNVLWMKRNFKQWWSIILPISTKRTITSHLNSLNIEKDQTYDVGNTDLGLGRHTHVEVLNRLMGSHYCKDRATTCVADLESHSHNICILWISTLYISFFKLHRSNTLKSGDYTDKFPSSILMRIYKRKTTLTIFWGTVVWKWKQLNTF